MFSCSFVSLPVVDMTFLSENYSKVSCDHIDCLHCPIHPYTLHIVLYTAYCPIHCIK